METKSDIRIVLAGHIDHGKSTLIGRLLYETGNLPDELAEALQAVDRDAQAGGEDRRFAYVLDHLSEERRNNITIDTAQVFIRLAGQHYTLIDAPGHREFVRNMVTGASQADAALLLVAANEGVREQTRRHCNLLAMLGIRQIIVVVNKMDKVLFSQRIFQHIADELTRHLAQSGLQPPIVVPLSAQRGINLLRRPQETGADGNGLAWYSGPSLVEVIQAVQPAIKSDMLPAMPVQDVYDRDGNAVLAGRIEGGHFAAGDRVALGPDGSVGTIRSIETFAGPTPRASAGWCVAVDIQGLSDHPRRGQVMTPADKPLPVCRRIVGRLFWMSQTPLRDGSDFQFRCGTQEVACRVDRIVSRINSETLLAAPSADVVEFTDIAQAELSFEQGVVMTAFGDLPELGRFTLCRDKEVYAGGIVQVLG
jgi:bifunctional enzyme CysN/CysC